MKPWQILLIFVSICIGPACVLLVKYMNSGYSEPKNAWKCKWIEPIDPADKRACAAIPDDWNGNQFARCMVKLGHTRQCPEEVKP